MAILYEDWIEEIFSFGNIEIGIIVKAKGVEKLEAYGFAVKKRCQLAAGWLEIPKSAIDSVEHNIISTLRQAKINKAQYLIINVKTDDVLRACEVDLKKRTVRKLNTVEINELLEKASECFFQP